MFIDGAVASCHRVPLRPQAHAQHDSTPLADEESTDSFLDVVEVAVVSVVREAINSKTTCTGEAFLNCKTC